MDKTTKKGKTVSEIIKELSELQESIGGDPEVFVANVEEEGFDSIGTFFRIISAQSGETMIAFTRGDIFIQPN